MKVLQKYSESNNLIRGFLPKRFTFKMGFYHKLELILVRFLVLVEYLAIKILVPIKY